jgi:hypothetical protein
MDDYFDWVVGQLVADQTVLYTTNHDTNYVFLGPGTTMLGIDTIRYSVNGKSKAISRPFLTQAHNQYLIEQLVPSRTWCQNNLPGNLKNQPCNHCVLKFILNNYQQPNP